MHLVYSSGIMQLNELFIDLVPCPVACRMLVSGDLRLVCVCVCARAPARASFPMFIGVRLQVHVRACVCLWL